MTPFAYPTTPPNVWGSDVPSRDKFHPYFSQYSIYARSFSVPSHLAVYEPDNQIDGSCVAVITPEPELGAKLWTLYGKWITLGMYRDEGRLPGYKPSHEAISWIRYDDQLVISDTEPHQLILGEEVEHHFTNVGSLTSTVLKIIDDYTFITGTTPTGATSGNSDSHTSWYKGNRLVNFKEEHVVFRLLPSFKLVPWAFVKQIFTESSPAARLTRRQLFDVTQGQFVKTSNTITTSTNYAVPTVNLYETTPPLKRRFNQVYDENKNPLKLAYDSLGLPKMPNYVDSEFKNNPEMLNGTIDNMAWNFRVFVYDYYGVEINDPDRSPFFANDLVYNDVDVSGHLNNIYRRPNQYGESLYKGPLFDEFANICIGVQSNRALTTRRAVLPLELDWFHHPIKKANQNFPRPTPLTPEPFMTTAPVVSIPEPT